MRWGREWSHSHLQERPKKLQSQLNSGIGQDVLMVISVSRHCELKGIFFVYLFLSPDMPINNQCIKWRANGINSSSFAQNSAENEAWSSCSLCLELLIRGPLQGISAWCYHDCLLEFHKGEGEWERQKEKGTNSSNKWIINGYLTATHRCRHSKYQPLGLLQKDGGVATCTYLAPSS